MAARNAPERSDSDRIRLIREEAHVVCSQRNARVWWAIGLMFMAICGAIGAGTGIAIRDGGTLRENSAKIRGNEKSITDVKRTLERMDDKLDRLLQSGRK